MDSIAECADFISHCMQSCYLCSKLKMLQRLQTYYLAVVLIIQGIAASGMDFFIFRTDDATYAFNSWGISKFSVEGKLLDTTTIPVFIGFIALGLIAFLTIMSYKNLDRQFKLGRTLFYLYFVSVLAVYLMSLFGENMVGLKEATREMGLAYWLFIVGFPFSFLANTNIKRDKRLLDSFKRL